MCLGYTNMNIDLDRFSARRGRPGYEEEAKVIVKEFFNRFLLVGTRLFIQQIPYNFVSSTPSKESTICLHV